MNLKFYLDNKLIREPAEYRDITLELNFEDVNEVKTAISQEKFSWVHENADSLNQYVTDGISGGLGIYWGVPLRIELDGKVLFNGFVNLAKNGQFSCKKVIADIREAKELDWIEEYADGFGFDLLYSKAIITSADFTKMPYINSDIPDYKQAAIFFLYAFVIGREIVKLIKDIANVLSDLAGTFTTIAGVLKLIFLIVYLVILIIAVIKIVQQMLEELIQPVKYHFGMLAKSHFEKACQYLNLTFESSLFSDNTATNNELASGLWKNMLLLPEKHKKGFKRNASTTQMGYFNGTFGDFLRGMLATFNARFTIINGVFRFERRDYGSSTAVYKIPKIKRDFHGYNADEIVSNYLVQFQIDNLDLNTVNRYAGTNAKNYITSKVTDPTKTELISGLKQPPIPFALGRRKNELTRVEDLIRDFLLIVDALLNVLYPVVEAVFKVIVEVVKAINKVIKVINAVGGKIKPLKVPKLNLKKNALSGAMTNRIGMLSLSDDMFGVPKLILIEGSGWDVKVTADNETKLSAENLWNKYHYLESMVPSVNRPAGNQAHIFEIAAAPFCLDDYYLVRGLQNQNEGEAKVISPDGNPCRIRSIKWNIWDKKASIKYYEQKIFTNNLQEQLLINTGE